MADNEAQTLDLPTRGAGLNEERKQSIRNALQRYRETVLELNMKVVEIVVQDTEEQPPPEDCPEDRVEKARIEHLRVAYGLRLDLPDSSISTVRDLLSDDRREALIASCQLDGVNHGEVDIAGRERWLADLEREALNVQGAEPRPNPFPKDLKYLGALVRGMCGPGLPEYRQHTQFAFLTDLDELGEYSPDRVDVPLSEERMDRNEFNALSLMWDEWEVSVGARLGDGEIAWNGGYVIYSRHKSDSERGEWRWRYGVKDDDFGSELYDTVEDFLGWYAFCGKQSEEDDNIETHPIDMDHFTIEGVDL